MTSNKYLLKQIIISVFIFFFSNLAHANDTIRSIVYNVEQVCAKPDKAGSFWDIRVLGSGDAKLKLLQKGFDVTGEVEFSRTEWDGVKNSVENSVDYRDCVKYLTPLFIQKFESVVNTSNSAPKKKRTLGGIKWMVSHGEIDFVLDNCKRKGNRIECVVHATSNEPETQLSIYHGSAIFDQEGYAYSASHARVANYAGELNYSNRSYVVKSNLTLNTKTPIAIRFSNVREEATAISKLQIVLAVNDDIKVVFRNIEIAI